MNETTALELLDCYLDCRFLSDDESAALMDWMREHPSHARIVLRRIVLHSSLRSNFQSDDGSGLPQEDIARSMILLEENQSELLLSATEAVFPTLHDQGNRADSPQSRDRKLRWAVGCVIAFAGILGAYLWMSFLPAPSPVAYEGFDYSPTLMIQRGDPPPENSPVKTMARSGGSGWAETWIEQGRQTSQIVSHSHQPPLDPSNPRSTDPLRYVDRHGRVLSTLGNEMRTASSTVSRASRRLDVTQFPAAMQGEGGLGRDGSALWFSFLAQSAGPLSGSHFAFLELGTDHAGVRVGRLPQRQSANWAAGGVLLGNLQYVRESQISFRQPVLFVGHIQFQGGSEDVHVWLNPELRRTPAMDTAQLHFSAPDFRLTQVSFIANVATDFDELRLGPTFSSVCPTRISD